MQVSDSSNKPRGWLWVGVMVALIIAGIGYAEKVDPDGSAFPRWFKSFYVGPTGTRNPTTSANALKNRVTSMNGCTIDYDFADITAAPGYEQFTAPYSCPGVKLGDPCFVGVAAASPADGGSAWESQVNFNAIAKKDNYVVIKLTTTAGDGGAMNPPDAGYNVRCISNQ